MSNQQKARATPLIAFVLVSFAVAGYFTGLQAPMNASTSSGPRPVGQHVMKSTVELEVGVIPATPYREMPDATGARHGQTRLANLKSTIDPLAEITIAPGDKAAALLLREQNRAFNGAPPTIPHPIDQRSDIACVACHREGAKTKTLRIPRMSHEFLANCTQCHVESNPRHMTAFASIPWCAASNSSFNLDAVGLYELPRLRRTTRDSHNTSLEKKLPAMSCPVSVDGSNSAGCRTSVSSRPGDSFQPRNQRMRCLWPMTRKCHDGTGSGCARAAQNQSRKDRTKR